MNLQVIKSGDSIAQDVVVSGSAFGSILSEISNLTIACICYDTGISRFLNILVVIIIKAGAHKCYITLQSLKIEHKEQ